MKNRSIGLMFVMFVCVSSGRADSIYDHRELGDTNRGQQMKLELFDLSQQEAVPYLQHQHSNNGKHLGFSVASVRQGPRLDVVGYYDKTSPTQNPEPATMILMGMGLLALGVYARKRLRH